MNKKLTFLFLVICCAVSSPMFATEPDSSVQNPKTGFDWKNGIFSGRLEANLVLNPGFENHTSNWTLGKQHGASGLFTTDSTEAISDFRSALIVTEIQEKDYTDVQLFTFLELSAQTRYSISFRANVHKTSLISISISNGVETFYEKKFLLRPEVAQYGPFDFSSNVDDPFSYFSFNLGKTDTEIRVDDVVIQADYTEKEFNQIVTNPGINIHQYNDSEGLYISLPRASSDDLPALFMDEKGRIISATKIRKGEQEVHFALDPELELGKYVLKIFTPSKTLAYNFTIQ